MGSSSSKFCCGGNEQADQTSIKYDKDKDKKTKEEETAVCNLDNKYLLITGGSNRPALNENVQNVSVTIHENGQRSKSSGQGTDDQVDEKNNTKKYNFTDIKSLSAKNGVNKLDQLQNIPYADEASIEALQKNGTSRSDNECKEMYRDKSDAIAIQRGGSKDSKIKQKHYSESEKKKSEKSTDGNKNLQERKQVDSNSNKSTGSGDSIKAPKVGFECDTRKNYSSEPNLEFRTDLTCEDKLPQNKDLSDTQSKETKAKDEDKQETALKQTIDKSAGVSTEESEKRNISKSNNILKSKYNETKTNFVGGTSSLENSEKKGEDESTSSSSDSSESSESNSSEQDSESDDTHSLKVYKAVNMQTGKHNKIINQIINYSTSRRKSSNKGKSHKRETESTNNLQLMNVNTRHFSSHDIQTKTKTLVSKEPSDGAYYIDPTAASTSDAVPSGSHCKTGHRRREPKQTANDTFSRGDSGIMTDSDSSGVSHLVDRDEDSEPEDDRNHP